MSEEEKPYVDPTPTTVFSEGDTECIKKLAELQQERTVNTILIKELNKEISELNKEISELRDETVRLAEKSDTLADKLRNEAKPKSPWAAWISIALFAATSTLLLMVWQNTPSTPESVVVEPPAAPPTTVAVPVSPPQGPPALIGSDDTGYLVDTGMEIIRRPWPSAAGYPADVFLQDCHDVCALPDTMASGSGVGRVLVADPAHLVCVCFHPGAGTPAWSIQRWVGWERIR